MSIELDIPDIKVLVRTDPNYNVVIQNPRSAVYRSGSYMSVAETALFAETASHANNNILTASSDGNNITFTKGNAETFTISLQTGSVDSASFATTASYAQTINRQITGSVVISDDLTVQGIISAEKLLVSSSVIYESGSTKFGDSPEDTHQFTGSILVQGPISASGITGSFKGDGSQLTGLVTDLRISGSTGSDTLNLLTDDLLITGSKGIAVAVTNNTVTIDVPTGLTASLYGTASVADGIDVVIAGIYETGSEGVIIPAPSGGLIYITTASYALTASYISNNTWNNLLNIPDGLVSSSNQVYYFPVLTAISSSYATTASYAMNGGGGGAPGSSGTSGTSGTSGSSGTSGQNGTSGTSGTSGSSGTSGTSGVLPAGALSSSQQILNYNIFATTGSNVFVGTQIITGSLIHGLEGNIATGDNSHAEGSITKAIGNYSHAEGDNTQAKGDYSHAEGQETIASGSYSHAEGYQTIALGNNQHVQGQYNATSSVPSAFIVGNGTDDINRSNLIFAVGNEVQIIGNQTVTGSLTVSGSSTFTNIGPAVFSGSVTTTAGVTGSLFGTSSFATTATSASYTLAAALYLLEAYANVTYTLPGTFTEDPCRYSIVNNTVNVPSSWFNTSSYTFTPQKAGYWEIAASYDVYRNTEASMAIKKNGSIVAAAGSFNAVAQQIRKIVYLNGSTDYINIINVGGAALSRGQFDSRSWFQARWIGE